MAQHETGLPQTEQECFNRLVRDTRHRILAAAADVLSVNPGATVADVAASAGLGRTTVHRLFPTRDALVRALAIDAIDRLDAALNACHLDEGSAPEVLARVAAALVPISHEFRFLEAGPDVWELDGEVSKRWYRLADRLEAVVERGKRSGHLRSEIPTAWLVDLVAVGVWCAGASIDDGRIARNDAARLLVEVLLRGAATPAGPREAS
jgi:AcrR family transcriptional regulator